jgi:hypothetical protein
MRRAICIGLALLLFAGDARGQDEPKPEDLKKMYNDTLVQLKAAQDRKTQLATENEKLAAHVAQLEKQVAVQGAQIDQLRHQPDAYSEQTFFLHIQCLAWQQFLDENPLIKLQWDFYLERLTMPLGLFLQPAFFDPNWPLSSRG